MLQRLDEKWERIAKAKKEKGLLVDDEQDTNSPHEASFPAFSRQRDQHRRQSDSSGKCFKCGSSTHRSIACPYAERGFDYCKKLRIREKGDESDEDLRVYEPILVRSPNYGATSRRPSPAPSGRSSPSNKSHTTSRRDRDDIARSSNWRSRGKSISSTKGVTFEDKAHVADSNSDSESGFDEFGGLSWERRSEIPITQAAADSGCTSHMTDVDALFSEAVKPCRRSIQVGGGRIWSNGIGTAAIKLSNGRKVFLADTLRVPGLGCTLLLAKKLSSSGLIGEFNERRMVFSRPTDHVPMIEAIVKGGLYIVSKIALEADGITFKAIEARPPTTP